MIADMYNDSKHTATGLTSDLAALEGENEELLWGTGLHYRWQSTELALIQPIVLHSGGMHNVNWATMYTVYTVLWWQCISLPFGSWVDYLERAFYILTYMYML